MHSFLSGAQCEVHGIQCLCTTDTYTHQAHTGTETHTVRPRYLYIGMRKDTPYYMKLLKNYTEKIKKNSKTLNSYIFSESIFGIINYPSYA